MYESPTQLKMLRKWNTLKKDRIGVEKQDTAMISLIYRGDFEGESVDKAEVSAFVGNDEAEQHALMLELMRNPEPVLNRNC